MQAGLGELQKQVAELAASVQALREENAALRTENKLLQQKNQLLLRRLFGRQSEKLDSRQMELLLGELVQLQAAAVPPPDDDPPPRPRGPRPHREPRLPEDLPTEEVVLDPEEVKHDPKAYRCIGQDVTEELDVTPARYLRRLYIRRKYVAKADRRSLPIQAPMPARPIGGGYASPNLLADIVVRKFEDHLPLYRQEQILRNRHGIELPRQTMSEWGREVADWLGPVYRDLQAELRASGYLQVDETPIRYCQAEGGGSALGFFWVYHDPGSRQVLYEWHTSRAARCLEGMCAEFRGTLQSDGYIAYESFAKERASIELAGCWAHARRKFHEAREEDPKLAGWFLYQIGLLYRVEARLRKAGASATLRGVARACESRMIVERIAKALKVKLAGPLPRSLTGGAIAYALGQWEQLVRFCRDGRLEIDNNGVENAIRPTAVGKKNWLFIGHPEAGQRSAVIYTLLENCRRLGINAQEYLCDLLTRLPGMTNQQTHDLTPAKWLAARRQQAA
jgi:transposase